MAGAKRKVEASQGATPAGAGATSTGSMTPSADPPMEDNSNIRITRSARASRDARAHNMNIPSTPSSTNNTTPNNLNNGRPSRIITLSTRTARANSARQAQANSVREAQANNAPVADTATSTANPLRETRTSRARAAAAAAAGSTVPSAPAGPPAPAPAATDSVASTNIPETPRHKRVKRTPTVEETPRTTRQSARLRGNIQPVSSTEKTFSNSQAESKQPDGSPSAGMAPGGRTRTRSRQMASSLNQKTGDSTRVTSSPSKKNVGRNEENISPLDTVASQLSTRDQMSDLVDEKLSKDNGPDNVENKMNGPLDMESEEKHEPETVPPNSLKRKSPEPDDGRAGEPTPSSGSPRKKPKVENPELDRALDQQLQEGTVINVDDKAALQSQSPGGVDAISAEGEVEASENGALKARATSVAADADVPNVQVAEISALSAANASDKSLEIADAADNDTTAARGSAAGDESRQITEEVEEQVSENGVEFTVSSGRGRGRGRGRGGGGMGASTRGGGVQKGKGKSKGPGKGKGKGKTRKRGRKADGDNDQDSGPEPEPLRSPSPTPATQKMRDRQRELDKAFKKVAAAQRLALSVLAEHSQRKLARDKNAHKKVPEFDEVTRQLQERLERHREILRREYEYKVANADRVLALEKENLEIQFRRKAREIQHEHLLASQGAYMAFVEGRRAAEDDEHTETDESETEADRGRIRPPARDMKRGYYSSFVRNPAGAALYERALNGWEDFVQRAKLGGDIEPQMNDMEEAVPFKGLSAHDVLNMIIEATGVVQTRGDATAESNKVFAPVPESRAEALYALADAATASPLPLPRAAITPRTPAHRAILPQPPQHPQLPAIQAPTDPRAFVLPPPNPQRQQPRRLLPAGQLPDPFAARNGPPQLPPPPGSNFQRPPLPGFLSGPPPPPLYYTHPPPPGPTGPPPQGPRPPF
ncbi:hypothetical protein KXW29_009226 [Aspergillus fumigatus]|uniref:Uncharacterized protein n=1 Tax=Aspergillus fumigatus TaxID=746128 RepID=A0A9P8SQ05_ASPFM|nr:hypothetical protein KXV57_009674 [Aspergillus fumigatus]KAH2722789.1 hypothetical protein KXW29_009226 [Aspergillus fumigatus]